RPSSGQHRQRTHHCRHGSLHARISLVEVSAREPLLGSVDDIPALGCPARLRTSRRRGLRRLDQTSAPAATDLPAFAARQPSFVRRPLMRGALLMRGAPALARNLALLFRRHRREAPSLFALCSHVRPSRTLPVPRRRFLHFSPAMYQVPCHVPVTSTVRVCNDSNPARQEAERAGRLASLQSGWSK